MPRLQDLVTGRPHVAGGVGRVCGHVTDEGAGLGDHVMPRCHVRGSRLAPRARESVTLIHLPIRVVTVVTLGRVGGASHRGVHPRVAMMVVVVAMVTVSTATAPSCTATASHARDRGRAGPCLASRHLFYGSHHRHVHSHHDSVVTAAAAAGWVAVVMV